MPLGIDLDNDLGLGLGLSTRKPKTPKLRPEEKQSLLEKHGQSLLSGVAAIGAGLDRFGGSRTLRGVVSDMLAGRAPDLLTHLSHLNPFSSPESYVSEADLRQQTIGGTGSWLGDTAVDFMIGYGLDPSAWILGPGRAITKKGAEAVAAKAAGKAVEILPNAKVADQLGMKVLGKGVTPIAGASPTQIADEIQQGYRGLFGVKPPWWIRKTLGLADEPMAIFGASQPWAVNAIDSLYYNPVSMRARQVFDNRVSKVGYDKDAHKAADAMTWFFDRNREAILTDAVDLERKVPQLEALFQSDIKNFLESNEDVARQLSGGADPATLNADTFLRSWAELRGGKDMATRLGALSKQLGSEVTLPQNVEKAIGLFDEHVNSMVQMKDYWHARATKAGVPTSVLEDLETEHFPRRIADILRPHFGKQSDEAAKTMWGSIHRSIQDVPGGTMKVNAMSRDERLVGKMAQMTPKNERLATLVGEYGIKPENAEELLGTLSGLPDEVLKTGLFSRSMLTDLVDYSLNAGHKVAGYEAVQRLLVNVADSEAIGPTLRQVLNAGDQKNPIFPFTDTARLNVLDGIRGKNQGAQQADDQLMDSLRVPEPFVQSASKMFAIHGSRETQNQIIKDFDKYTNLFRTGVYTLWPASHVRNAISGFVTNFYHAFDDTKDASKSLKDAWNLVWKGKGGEYSHEYQLFVGDKDVLAEIAGETGENARIITGEELKQTAREGFSRAGKELSEVTLADFISPESVLNPTNVRGVREALSKAQKTIDPKTGIETTAIKGTQFLPAQIMEKVGRMVETFNRYAMFSNLRSKGWSPSAAARQVKLTHFDYTQLTDAERTYFRRLAPFYSFTRFNLPAQIRNIVDQPGGATAQTLRFYRNAQEEADKRGFVPSRERKGLVVPLDEPGEFLTSYGLLPTDEAFGRFQTFTGGSPGVNAMETLKMLGENVIGMSPVASAALEPIVGRQFYTHRPLEDVHQEPTEMPWLNFLLYKSPLSRGLSTARQMTDPRKNELEKAFNFLVGGAKITDLDMDKELAREVRDVIQRAAKGQPGVSSWEQLYLSDPEKADPEVVKQIALLKAIQAESKKKAAAKKKKAS